MANANESLKDELERERREKEWAESWRPDEPGDMLIGTLQGYDEAETDFGSYTVAHIRDEEGVLRGLWLMHSVLQDEWSEADPGRGERVGVQYLGKRSGENYDYHMWTVKVDRPEPAGNQAAGNETTGNENGAERDSDRPPQESSGKRKSEAGGSSGGAKETAPEFEGDKLFGSPALDTDAADSDEAAGGESTAGESTLGDPNGALPF